MDPKRTPDPTGQGIELATRSPFQTYQEFSHSGIEVINQPSLEVVPQQEILHQRHSVPWEKKVPDYDNGPPPQTAHSTVPPTYGYPSPYEQSFDQRPLMPVPPAPPEIQQERLILGLKRQTFFIILAVGIFFTVAGIAAGVGVGVALKGNDAPSASTTSAINTATRVFPLPTAQATTGPTADIKCPSNNLTSYISQVNDKKQFTLLCGRDYASQQGSADLFNQATDTMSECIDLCAEQGDCVGVGWGDYRGTYVCWLKKRLAQPGWALAWYFAALDDVSGLALPTATPAPESRRVV
ncbi:hypothetical protein OQA88_216 [Cercophora sp. LCS_1]